MPTEKASRVKAARGYGGLSQPQLAKVLEMSDGTVKAIEGGRRVAKRSELLAIAEATGVPMWFLEGGWEGWRATRPGAGDDVDREGRAALEDLDQRADDEDEPRPGEDKAEDA
jgi:transcriptional regulator with XRE-family HTH domain